MSASDSSESRLENINDLLDRLATLTRYGCVGPEGDYDAGMEAGAGDYVDGETVSDIVVQLRALLSETGTTEGYPGIAHDLETLRTALTEIAKGEGPFSRDPLEHAGNTIDAMKKLASEALRSVK
jgi:hypothetical protein